MNQSIQSRERKSQKCKHSSRNKQKDTHLQKSPKLVFHQTVLLLLMKSMTVFWMLHKKEQEYLILAPVQSLSLYLYYMALSLKIKIATIEQKVNTSENVLQLRGNKWRSQCCCSRRGKRKGSCRKSVEKLVANWRAATSAKLDCKLKILEVTWEQ